MLADMRKSLMNVATVFFVKISDFVLQLAFIHLLSFSSVCLCLYVLPIKIKIKMNILLISHEVASR